MLSASWEKTGRGKLLSYHNVMSRVDIVTGTLGKAWAGASGGYSSGARRRSELLRRASRPISFPTRSLP